MGTFNDTPSAHPVLRNWRTGHPINIPMASAAIRGMLLALGEPVDSHHLIDTPDRAARAWAEILSAYQFDATTFEPAQSDQLIAVTGVRVWTVCEHHLLPFYCDVSIAYVSKDKMIGLSKLARIAQAAGRSLQVQERLVAEIAMQVKAVCGTDDVAVMGTGVHLCAVMRGVREANLTMTTSDLSGCFRTEPAARQEFFNIVQRAPQPRL